MQRRTIQTGARNVSVGTLKAVRCKAFLNYKFLNSHFSRARAIYKKKTNKTMGHRCEWERRFDIQKENTGHYEQI